METLVESKAVHRHGITSRGRLQSTLLGRAFTENDVTIDTMYSGPAKRHLETANQIASTIDAITGEKPEVIERPDLDDVDWGTAAVEVFTEGEPPSIPDIIEGWVEGDIVIREGLSEVMTRVLAVAHDLSTSHTHDETVLVTTSGVNIYLLVLDAFGLEPGDITFYVHHASLFELRVSEGTKSVVQVNGLTHLPDTLVTNVFRT